MLALSGAWACVMTLLGVMALCSGNPLTGIIVGTLNWIPYYLVKLSVVKGEARAKARLKESAMSPPGFIHVERGTGIALFPLEQRIAVLDRKRLKSYAYPDLWDWKIPEHPAGRVMRGGLNGAAQKRPANTGIYLRVRDNDHPEWKINMLNQPDRRRWLGILTQELNADQAQSGFTQIEKPASLTA